MIPMCLMGFTSNLRMDTICIKCRKYTVLFKNYSNIDGEMFVIYYLCQSKQDNGKEYLDFM